MPHGHEATMLLTALGLGFAHGFDADHLATIDGLSRRFGMYRRWRAARLAGTAFSLGHGSVVMAVTLLGAVLGGLALPSWMEAVGIGISVSFLVVLGWSNFRLAWHGTAQAHMPGLRARFGARLAQRLDGNPLSAALVGALFALSFDTLSQAAVFALMGMQLAGHTALLSDMTGALCLALTFIIGMVLADGGNGLLIAWMVARGERFACHARRALALVIALSAWAVAVLALGRHVFVHLDRWFEGRELLLGLAVVSTVTLAFMLGYGFSIVRPPKASRLHAKHRALI